MTSGNKPSATRSLDPLNASLSGQAKVNAEIFTAVEILGRKLERVEAERDRLARRLALIESAATLDEKTGKYYLPVVVDREEAPLPPSAAPRWMVTTSLMSGAIALFALGLVFFREPTPVLTKDQVAALETLRLAQFAQLSPESKGWKSVDASADTSDIAASTPSPAAQLPDRSELAQFEQSAEALNEIAPAAQETPAEPAAPTESAAASIDPHSTPIPGEDKVASVQAAPEAPAPVAKPAPPKVAEKPAAPKPVKNAGVAHDTGLTGKLAELEARANAGVPEAQHDLATLYAAGGPVPQDYKRANAWFEKAAENGVANAYYNIGVMNHQGLGMPVNLTRALSSYQKAAELGHPEALYNLGIAYIEGIGTKADTDKGVAYFKRAAKAGVAQAAYNLGVLYESNFIGAIDTKKAAEWYSAAAKQGHEEAKAALARLNDGKEQALANIAPAAGDDEEEFGEGDASPVSEMRPPAAAPAKKPTGTLADIQRLLIKQGLLPGKADGMMNQQTEDAIRAAQSKLGMVEDGQPSRALLEKLLQKPPLAQ